MNCEANITLTWVLGLLTFIAVSKRFGFVGFYGISTVVGYLMPNLVSLFLSLSLSLSLYLYIYMNTWFLNTFFISSSSSCRATGTDIPHPLSPLLTIAHRLWQVLRTTSRILTQLLFELVVLLLPGHMWGSIGVHHFWARPCFPSSVLYVWFV